MLAMIENRLQSFSINPSNEELKNVILHNIDTIIAFCHDYALLPVVAKIE